MEDIAGDPLPAEPSDVIFAVPAGIGHVSRSAMYSCFPLAVSISWCVARVIPT